MRPIEPGCICAVIGSLNPANLGAEVHVEFPISHGDIFHAPIPSKTLCVSRVEGTAWVCTGEVHPLGHTEFFGFCIFKSSQLLRLDDPSKRGLFEIEECHRQLTDPADHASMGILPSKKET